MNANSATAHVYDPVARWAAHEPERIALVADDDAGARVCTYHELHVAAEHCRARLAACGVRAGSRVALLALNRVESVTLLLACIRLGAILVPLNWRLTPPELALVLAHAEPALLVGEPAFRALADTAAPAATSRPVPWHDLAVIAATTSWPHAGSPPPVIDAEPPAHHPQAHDVVMLLYTSGSSGEPKGVLIPHRQLYWNAVTTVSGWELSEHDVAFVMTPLFHTAGWHVFLTPLLWCGGRVVLAPVFDADETLAVLDRYGVTVTFAVPTQLDMLRESRHWGAPLPALRTIVSGGAPCPPRVLDHVRRAGYTVRDAYGLTECGPNCFVASDAQARAHPGSVGWPLPGLDTRVVNEAGAPVPVGEIGELQHRGPQQCAGYFRNAELTAALVTSDGWLRTGDLARIDEHGAHYLCGRRSDVYISGGEKVVPAEVESALRACAGVHDVVVVGVPDALWGEVGYAVIQSNETALDLEGVKRTLRERLAGYKVPHTLRIVPALPRLGSGKVDRRAVRSLALEATAGAAPTG